MRRLALLASVVVLAGSFVVSVQGQGKGKGRGGANADAGASTVSVVMYLDNNGNGVPNWNDKITFDVSTTETTQPHVQLVCFQNGDVVYGADWPVTPVLTLSSRAWQGGAAECTATAYYFSGSKNVTIASNNFTAYE
jgi:hypothetical protein